MEERLLLAATELPAELQGQLLRSVWTAPRTAPVSPGGAVSAWPAQLPVSRSNLALRPDFGSVSGRFPWTASGPARFHPRPPYVTGPLIVVANRDLLAGVTTDQVASQPGTVFPGSQVEPYLAMNPLNAHMAVGVWQQDRWSDEGARAIGVAVTQDAGQHWRTSLVPGLTLATGGTYQRASDPWAAFSADGRVLYVASLPFNNTNPDGTGGESAVAVSRSLDGGRHWDRPVLLDQQTSPSSQTDKDSIATDPVKPRLAYSAWERLQIPLTLFPFRGPAMFSRTTDAGRTWEPARVLYDPGDNALTINHQLFPRANGTLYDVFTTFRVTALPPNPPAFQNHLTVLVSPDRGATWGNPIFGPELLGAPVIAPNSRAPLRTASTPSGFPAQFASVAMDSRTGTLYAVWQDARFSTDMSTPIDRIVFSRSTDGGQTWSDPTPINATPTAIPPLDQQAFVPAIQVAGDGTIGVSYYDFRNNRPSATGGLADAWMVFCPPGADPTLAASWGGEVRLTNHSFEIAQAPLTTGGVTGGGYFLGDYVGLGATGHAFQAFFSVTTGQTATVVSRLVVPSWQRFH